MVRPELHYDNASKLATTSTGVDVTGTVTADGLKLVAANSEAIIGNNASYQGKIKYNDGLGEFEFRNTYDTTLRGYAFYRGSTDKTSLRLDGNGDISFYEDTGTTAKFFWDASAERLGIGTSSPSTPLHISATSPTLWLQGGASGQSNINLGPSGDGDEGGIFYNQSGNYLGIRAGAAERLRIDSSGKVGIGTSSPAEELDVYGSIGLSGKEIARRSGNNVILGDVNAAGGAGGVTLRTNGGDKLTINTSGNVGIGTSSPSAPLEVDGAVNGTQAVFTGQASRGLKISTTNADGSVNDGHVVLDAQHTYLPKLSLATAGTKRLTIDSSGNVGIGESSPADKLHIANGGKLRLERPDGLTYSQVYMDTGANGGMNFITITTMVLGSMIPLVKLCRYRRLR